MGRKKRGGAKRGREAPGRPGKGGYVRDMMARPVKEADRIEFRQLLEDFRASKDLELQFPSTLSNNDRAVIHALCAKLGLRSKSQGKDPNRILSISKSNNSIKESGTYKLPISEKAQQLIHKHFQRHPPTVQEEAAFMKAYDSPSDSREGQSPIHSNPGDAGTSGSDSSLKQFKPKRKRTRSCAASFSTEAVKSKLAALREARRSSKLQDIEKQRKGLPVAQHREEILEAINENQVMMLSGETGSGKTTQIPQYILEDCWSRGEPCRVMCTQPRRLSAVTVADRVAQEMGESTGQNVGYKIRLESKGGPQSSLMFCTNGVLLRMMTQGGDISRELTHIIVDEIHERDSYSDFLLILLRDILPANPGLKVVLMSATLHEELFQNYFNGCPVIRVKGRMFPVEDYYLEDILRLTGYEDEMLSKEGMSLPVKTQPYCTQDAREALEEALHEAFVKGTDEAFATLTAAVGADGDGKGQLLNVQHSVTGVTALSTAVARGRMDEIQLYLSKGADPSIPARNGKTAIDFAGLFEYQEIAAMLQKKVEEEEQRQSDHIASLVLHHYHSKTNVEEVDMDLIERLLMFICGEGPWCTPETDQERQQDPGAILIFLPGWDEILRLKMRLSRSAHFCAGRYLFLPLHSQIPPSEQKRAFQRPPPGVRKLILATNIAETSVTIEDVTVVVNSGRLKHKSHDPYCGVSTLMSDWTAKANERQRRGRAGRCQPGVAFHLYSTARGESFSEYVEPELKRTSLEEICLLVKMACGEHGDSISSFLSKAPDPPISEAVTSAINLLKDIGALDEEEKLTVMGRHLGALPVDPKLGKMLLYGILLKCLDPILTVACSMEYRDPWVLPLDMRDGARTARTKFGNLFAGNSDHLSTVAAFKAFKQLHGAARRHFCEENFLSPATMAMIEGMREQIRGLLMDLGLVESDPHPKSLSNVNSEDITVVRCALSCGLYPMVGCLKGMKIVTKKGEKVAIHRGSLNTKGIGKKKGSILDKWSESSLFAFDEVTRGDGGLYVRNTTVVKPHPFPLIAGNVSILEESMEDLESKEKVASCSKKKILCLDSWLRFLITESSAKELCILRLRIAEAFSFKVSHPRARFPPNLEHAIRTIIDYFKLDAGPPPPEPTLEVPNLNPVKSTAPTSRSHPQHSRYPGSYRMRNQGPSSFRHTPQHSLPSHSRRGATTHSSASRQHAPMRPQVTLSIGDRFSGHRKARSNHSPHGRLRSAGGHQDRKPGGSHRGADIPLPEAPNSAPSRGSRDVLVIPRHVLAEKSPQGGSRQDSHHRGHDHRGRGGRRGGVKMPNLH